MKRTSMLSGLALLTLTWATAVSAAPSPAQAQVRLAVLELVDLADNQQAPESSELLRKSLAAAGGWTVIGRDSVAKRLTEFNVDPRQACNNSQCAFDIGNVVQAEYVVFGTASLLASAHAVTLKLLHIPTARIVWTKVAEGHGSSQNERKRNLEKVFVASAGEMKAVKANAAKANPGKSLAVIDLSENSLQSRAFFERVGTRIYGNPSYDLMSPTELTELLAALEINRYSVVPSLENMIGLGQKLGVSNLLYSRLYRDGRSYIYRLAMYDIPGKSLVLELPPQPSEDLIKLLDYERVFFNTLFNKEKAGQPPLAVKDGAKSNRALWISLGILGIGGGVAAYWVGSLGNDEESETRIPHPRLPPENP